MYHRRRRVRIKDTSLFKRIWLRFAIAVVLSFVLFTLAAALYYWISYVAGQNMFRETVVIYRQTARTREVEVDGRLVEQRYYESEAQPEIRRWQLVLPALIVNNLLLLIVFSALAAWYAAKLSGPVHRMKSDIRRVLQGEEGVQIRLRRNDEFMELAGEINRLFLTISRLRSPR